MIERESSTISLALYGNGMPSRTTKGKKYILHPGQVIDPKTGESSRMNAITLANLYGVSLSECVVLNTHGKTPFKKITSDLTGFIHLYPRPNGDYRL